MRLTPTTQPMTIPATAPPLKRFLEVGSAGGGGLGVGAVVVTSEAVMRPKLLFAKIAVRVVGFCNAPQELSATQSVVLGPLTLSIVTC